MIHGFTKPQMLSIQKYVQFQKKMWNVSRTNLLQSRYIFYSSLKSFEMKLMCPKFHNLDTILLSSGQVQTLPLILIWEFRGKKNAHLSIIIIHLSTPRFDLEWNKTIVGCWHEGVHQWHVERGRLHHQLPLRGDYRPQTQSLLWCKVLTYSFRGKGVTCLWNKREANILDS